MAASRILVVDDEPNVLKSWSRTLRLAGYGVRMARSGEEALRQCDEHHFDLVIVDFLMPTMTGVELLRRIRKKLPFIRSAVVSGKLDDFVSEADISRKLRETVEADVYLHKPVSNERLRETVKVLLESDRTSRDWISVGKQAKEAAKDTIESAKQASSDLKTLIVKKRKRKR